MSGSGKLRMLIRLGHCAYAQSWLCLHCYWASSRAALTATPFLLSCLAPLQECELHCHGALQVKAKYTATMVDLFRETFCWLPLAHVLNKRVFVVHGGLFAKDGVKLSDLRRVDRFRWVGMLDIAARPGWHQCGRNRMHGCRQYHMHAAPVLCGSQHAWPGAKLHPQYWC